MYVNMAQNNTHKKEIYKYKKQPSIDSLLKRVPYANRINKRITQKIT